MEAEAMEHISSSNDAVSAVQEARFGERNFGRFLGESVKSGFTGYADKFYQAIDFFLGKPITAAGRLIDPNYKSGITRWAEYYHQSIANPVQTEAEMAAQAMGGGGWDIGRQTIRDRKRAHV